LLFVIALLLSACSGSMWEASCGSMMPAFIIYLFYTSSTLYYSFLIYSLHIVHLSLSTCSGSVRYHAATRCRPLLLYFCIYICFMLYYLLDNVCSGSMRETSCSSRMPTVLIY
jgi:hypothetical protein